VLVIENNLCNNYCNISLNNTYIDLYISEPPVIWEGERKFTCGFAQFKRATKNPKPQKTLKLSLLTQESAAHPPGTKKAAAAPGSPLPSPFSRPELPCTLFSLLPTKQTKS